MLAVSPSWSERHAQVGRGRARIRLALATTGRMQLAYASKSPGCRIDGAPVPGMSLLGITLAGPFLHLQGQPWQPDHFGYVPSGSEYEVMGSAPHRMLALAGPERSPRSGGPLPLGSRIARRSIRSRSPGEAPWRLLGRCPDLDPLGCDRRAPPRHPSGSCRRPRRWRTRCSARHPRRLGDGGWPRARETLARSRPASGGSPPRHPDRGTPTSRDLPGGTRLSPLAPRQLQDHLQHDAEGLPDRPATRRRTARPPPCARGDHRHLGRDEVGLLPARPVRG